MFQRLLLVLTAAVLLGASPASAETPGDEPSLRSQLDFPLLFTKRRNIQGIHIYDTYYKWFPGGGIYVLENPSDPPEKHRIRTVIDPQSKETLGEGMYWQPELSYDAKRLLFCHKGTASGSTSIYEIGIDGTGLKRLTNPCDCEREYHGRGGGVHDFGPSYLPDGRIVFTSNRYSSLIPCANEGSDILHTMNADGSDIRAISVNCETEFDPTVMEDGRILFGRWEYVDKTALTVQSLWTVYPDGTNETATYANNMVFPEAILDPRQVPGDRYLIVGSFTPHNSPPRGAVAMIDTRMGKNDPAAIHNFDTPNDPTNNRGSSCDPYPLSKDTILYSGKSGPFNAIMMVNKEGQREVILADATIDLHAPIPVRPRPLPRLKRDLTDRSKTTGKFFVQDIYEGMPEVKPGTVKYLRVLEDTSRTSPTPGGSPVNQTFLVSSALSFTMKDYMGVVPVEPDGSVYFEVPSGRAVFFQALDAEGRCVRSMRTFIQAVPGTTRACIGCHENKRSAYAPRKTAAMAIGRPVSRLQDESWGSGPIVYTEQIQPIFDRHCVSCHGGEEGIAAGLDLTGGWTELFNISYEHLSNRREVQYKAPVIGGIDCMNGTSYYSSTILPSYSHGSGKSLLTDILVDKAKGHEKRFDLPRAQRDLVLAWMDSNGQFGGTWDYVQSGFYAAGWKQTRASLEGVMEKASCVTCHPRGDFEVDWFNLQRPELSRILRAPLEKGDEGFGLGLCRERKADTNFKRLRMMTSGGYQHAVKPLSWFPAQEWKEWDESGQPLVTFKSTEDAIYQEMLAIIQQGRQAALATPRLDMPGAQVVAGTWRKIVPRPLPKELPKLSANLDGEAMVHLAWQRNTRTWGLAFEIHRGDKADFTPSADTLQTETRLFRWRDPEAKGGPTHYAIVLKDEQGKSSEPIRASIVVPPPKPPEPVAELEATDKIGGVRLAWPVDPPSSLRYRVYRGPADGGEFTSLNETPLAGGPFEDTTGEEGIAYRYHVRAVSARGGESKPSPEATGMAKPWPKGPVLDMPLAQNVEGKTFDDKQVTGRLVGAAKISEGALDLTGGGYLRVENSDQRFDLAEMISVECSVYLTKPGTMPVILSHGEWQRAGWFVQSISGGWRWHVGGTDCDGGRSVTGQWIHLRATYDGKAARLYQDGKLVGDVPCRPNLAPYSAPLMIGQYTARQNPEFQTTGRMKNVRIYRGRIGQ